MEIFIFLFKGMPGLPGQSCTDQCVPGQRGERGFPGPPRSLQVKRENQ